MPDNKQPIEYYVAEAKRLGLSEEQQSVIGDETDGEMFREHIANAHDMTDAELREMLQQEWTDYTAPSKDASTSFGRHAEAEDEANGRHADSDNFDDEEDEDDEGADEVGEDELDDEDDDFGSDVGEDDEDVGEDIGEEPEEDFDASADALDHLDIDEEAIERKRDGGGEALDDGEADCEGCKI